MTGHGGTVLSVEEIRAVARYADLTAPGCATRADPEDPRIDAAALRGLAARGLFVLEPSTPAAECLSAELSALLHPCQEAGLAAEVVRHDPSGVDQVDVVGGPAATLFRPLSWGLVSVTRRDVDVLDVVAGLCRVDDLVEPAAADPVLRVGHDAYGRSADLLEVDAPDDAIDVLVRAGAPLAAAHAWARAVGKAARHGDGDAGRDERGC